MILDSRSGLRGVLVDDATGRRIPFATWANTDTGEYVARVIGPNGKPTAETYRGKARLRFVASQAPAIKAKDEKPPAPRPRKGRRIVATEDVPCEHRTCYRWADWEVAEEEELPPETKGGKRFERARLLDTHFWCDWHYRAPTLYDARGELIRVHDEIKARPQ